MTQGTVHDTRGGSAGEGVPREDALDASQEALIRAWRGLPTLRDPSRFDPWLRSIAANAAPDAADRYRRSGSTLYVFKLPG